MGVKCVSEEIMEMLENGETVESVALREGPHDLLMTWEEALPYLQRPVHEVRVVVWTNTTVYFTCVDRDGERCIEWVDRNPLPDAWIR